MKSGSPLMGKLSGRYGTSGFSMGGGGTTYSAEYYFDPEDQRLDSHGLDPVDPGHHVAEPVHLRIGRHPCRHDGHGVLPKHLRAQCPRWQSRFPASRWPTGARVAASPAKLASAWQKVFLENDERWIPILKMVEADDSANLP